MVPAGAVLGRGAEVAARDASGGAQLIVPSLHFWEVGNVLRTYVRRREIERGVAEEIYSLHLDAPIEVAEPPQAQVLTTALDFEATVYDAVYISLALTYDVPLVTAERSTTPWVVKLGDRIRIIGTS
jgi:predicted nucleic acid-binding protein